MAEILDLSSRFIDEGIYEGPGAVNRVTTQLSELSPRIAIIEAFSHVVCLQTDAGLVLFDTTLEPLAPRVRDSLRGWSREPVHTIVYTHGHIDHVGGCQIFLDEARERGDKTPRVVAHENVPPRFARYALTDGYNGIINARQFGGAKGASPLAMGPSSARGRFGPASWVQPDTTFRDRMQLRTGDLQIELRHARGETDDHLWAWLPAHRAICSGDLLMWLFPNAGNPQKVQRYPLEWAAALRTMIGMEPELLLPAHGLPVEGAARVRRILDDTASVLESVVEQCLSLMNQGARLDTLIREVRPPAKLMERPYLRPAYDEPEFVVRNVWRLYGGWYDGNPANLKPASEVALAHELAELAGGAEALAHRGRALAEKGDLRLACHLVEMAALAASESREVHGARAEVYQARRDRELSLMAKGVYGAAARESREKSD